MEDHMPLPSVAVRWILSPAAQRAIDWNGLRDCVNAAVVESRGERTDGTQSAPVTRSQESPANLQLIQGVSKVLKEEFQRALQPLRRMSNFLFYAILAALAVIIVGICLSFVYPAVGAVASTSGVIALFPVLRQSWILARDQALLELTPAGFEAMVNLSPNSDQVIKSLEWLQRVLDQMRPG